MPYIKSHSNYVLSKKHQNVSDGTIWERDITTIGGVNQFAPGQTPIYNSNNFIITVRNDGKVANQYNQTKWKENESGDTWTLETISGITSEYEDQNDVKIVLKNDYYDFCDFAYYGSLTELFRGSINDALSRFPGELFIGTHENAYYTSSGTQDFEKLEERIMLGTSADTIVSNPFGIDVHSTKKPTDGKELKFFADNGFKNYEIILDDAESGTPITSWDVSYTNNDFCPGNMVASVSIDGWVNIDVWVGDYNDIIYLSNNKGNIHIRPKEEYLVDFYNGCDNFEKIILNRKTTPKYKSMFSVIKENAMGYYREMEEFIFPTSYGGYNIDSSSKFASRLSEIGEYYDTLFTDNMWRSMTHEAIKNFDWTYTREFHVGDDEEFVHGGEKIQKALRVFAREFDEIFSYIDNIKNVGRVTYDERSNVPDYFLIDEVEKKGFDAYLVYPYDLEEYYYDSANTKNYVSSAYTEQQQLDNKENDYMFVRQFSQNTKKEVKPYRRELLDKYKDGYFISCDGEVPCWYEDGEIHYGYLSAEGSGSTYYDESTRKIINRIKPYSNERSYTYLDANNEFIRRLAINAPYISRHKGTIEGIEMMLGMFGLKSKRWTDRLTENCVNSSVTYDYDITEYSSFTNRIEERWDAVHQMYRIDWINSTKAIVYDYRTTSNYTKYGTQPNYIPYQGLPISYRDEYLEYDDDKVTVKNKAYIEVSPLSGTTPQKTTEDPTKAFKSINENNAPVRRRYLYPNFNKYEQLDGNPYFQMGGGWLSKTVENSGETRYNFQYDVDDNIAYTKYIASGKTNEDGSIIDNDPIYKETIRNIKRVDSIADLIATPVGTIEDGTIIYVSNVEKDIAIIDNEVFTIKHEYYKPNGADNGEVYDYVSLIMGDEYIKVGDSKFFNTSVVVYDRDGNKAIYELSDKESGYEVKAYIKKDKEPKFICQANMDGSYTIDSFMILDDEKSSASTNYFIIDDSYYADRLASEDGKNGWRRLNLDDAEYIRVNTISNYYKGNNPHNGNMKYDGGHEYFTYFKRLFKYPIQYGLFDERCYESFYYDLDNEIYDIGFSGLIDDNESIKQYFPYISGLTDSKIHYFGSYYKLDDSVGLSAATSCDTVMFYGEEEEKRKHLEEMYQETINDKITVTSYTLSSDTMMIDGSPYSAQSGIVDEVTDQILNNKRMTITFNLHDKWYTNKGQCELKYLDNIVMNYLTQMIPSTAIVDIRYIYVEKAD